MLELVLTNGKDKVTIMVNHIVAFRENKDKLYGLGKTTIFTIGNFFEVEEDVETIRDLIINAKAGR